MLFTLGCGILFYACVVEPFSLRKSYHKFLTNLSGGRATDYQGAARWGLRKWKFRRKLRLRVMTSSDLFLEHSIQSGSHRPDSNTQKSEKFSAKFHGTDFDRI